MYAGNYGRVHSISARSEMGAFHVWFASNALVPTNSYDLRNLGFAIRLASRSGLFDCSVDGVSLLFLPAAGNVQGVTSEWGHGWLWSMTAHSAGFAYSVGMNGNGIHPAWGRGVFRRKAIRLASRSELFGCSVDGVGVSVPARCGPNRERYFRLSRWHAIVLGASGHIKRCQALGIAYFCIWRRMA